MTLIWGQMKVFKDAGVMAYTFASPCSVELNLASDAKFVKKNVVSVVAGMFLF